MPVAPRSGMIGELKGRGRGRASSFSEPGWAHFSVQTGCRGVRQERSVRWAVSSVTFGSVSIGNRRGGAVFQALIDVAEISVAISVEWRLEGARRRVVLRR